MLSLKDILLMPASTFLVFSIFSQSIGSDLVLDHIVTIFMLQDANYNMLSNKLPQSHNMPPLDTFNCFLLLLLLLFWFLFP